MAYPEDVRVLTLARERIGELALKAGVVYSMMERALVMAHLLQRARISRDGAPNAGLVVTRMEDDLIVLEDGLNGGEPEYVILTLGEFAQRADYSLMPRLRARGFTGNVVDLICSPTNFQAN